MNKLLLNSFSYLINNNHLYSVTVDLNFGSKEGSNKPEGAAGWSKIYRVGYFYYLGYFY